MSPSRRWFVVPAFVLVAGFAVIWESWVDLSKDGNSALLYWQRHVEAHPKFALGYSRLGLAYEGVEDWGGAERTYTAALSLEPNLEEVAIGLSGVVRRTRGRKAAVDLLAAFLVANPGCGVCSYNLASDYLVLGEASLAKAEIDRALVTIDSADAETYGGGDLLTNALVMAGRVYDAIGQPLRAMHFLEDAVARNPKNVEAQLWVGQLRMRADPAATAPHWRKFADLAPEDVRGPLFEARAELEAEHFDSALRALDAAESRLDTSKAPGHWKYEIAFDRARVSFRRHDLDRARSQIRDLIRRSTETEKIARAEKFLARIDAAGSGGGL